MGFRMDYGGLINGSVPTLPDMKLPSFAGHFELVNHQLVQVLIPCLTWLAGIRCPAARCCPPPPATLRCSHASVRCCA